MRTLPESPYGIYYEKREVHNASRRFTSARADARSVHYLPLSEHGNEPPDSSVRAGEVR